CIPVSSRIEVLEIWVVLIDREGLRCCRLQPQTPAEESREDLVGIRRVARNGGSIRERDPDRRSCSTSARLVNKGSPTAEELRERLHALCAHHLAGRRVD